jgi:hypothetical protein
LETLNKSNIEKGPLSGASLAIFQGRADANRAVLLGAQRLLLVLATGYLACR